MSEEEMLGKLEKAMQGKSSYKDIIIENQQKKIDKQKEVLDKIKDKCLENMYIDDRGEEVENIERDIKPSEILELLEEIE